uniref:Autoinducer-binding domain protein n=1 Tax=uncultured Thiotrichaceae bacterium TaxID=298394 RepID=A0A6S6UNZ0_9GAMM|nr:MAG: Autoinducer-binding domain protein [uncultured Thiotrichaceae bacterium]
MTAADSQLTQFLNDLHATKSFETALSLYQKYVLALGYDGVLYGFAPKLFATDSLFNSPVYRACGLYSDEFLQYYDEKNLVQHDFTVKSIVSGCMEEVDWGNEEFRQQLSCQERNVLEVSRRYGLKNGISLPLMNNCNGYAGISVCSGQERPEFEALNQKALPLLRQYSQIFNGHIWAHYRNQLGRLSSEVVLSKLSPTELELLRHLPSGDMLKVIYNKMEKTPSYGDNILGRLRDKMGGVSTNRLIYYASLLVTNDYL